MKTRSLSMISLALALCSSAPTPAIRADSSALQDFVIVRGDQLIEGGKPFRFVSFNIPNLLLIEDNVAFKELIPWRLPDKYEINDALESVLQMGGSVVRTYVISVVRTNDAPNVPRHVLGPGKFNETAFRALDEALNCANRNGVRLIVPLVDNWSWWGGRAEYAGFRGKGKDAFWTDPQIIADFKETIRFVLTRTNTITGVRYCDDKAILGWETGNELESTIPWTREIAAYMKSLDKNHLVIDGFANSPLRDAILTMPEIDMVTSHHYPGGRETFAQLIRANWEKARGKKPFFVGEFGFITTPGMLETIEAVRQTGAAGVLVWSLRMHNRDGGYYWHSEPASANVYKAFHWPGSPVGSEYDEMGFMSALRRHAFEIRGVAVPPVSKPKPPTLLPIADASAIAWQGSAGAASYIVERSSRAHGPWTPIARNIDESTVQYQSLFADTNVSKGTWYYQVRAVNEAGVSEPSNVIGPVRVKHASLVDEMADFSQMSEHTGVLSIQTHDCRKVKEDIHRVAGKSGDSMTYHVNGRISAFRVYAFFPVNIADFRFEVSANGSDFQPVTAKNSVYFGGKGDYDYWKPVCSVGSVTTKAAFLKITYTGDAQIGRMEIDYK